MLVPDQEIAAWLHDLATRLAVHKVAELHDLRRH
jgi:hypothetical protein